MCMMRLLFEHVASAITGRRATRLSLESLCWRLSTMRVNSLEVNEARRILIVEDDEQIAGFVCQGLTEAGFQVNVAHNGIDGLELALRGTHSAVILDIMLPGMDGLELLRHLK